MGWREALSALTGGLVIISATWLTIGAIEILAADDPKKMRRKIQLQLVWRLLLLGGCLYVMLQTNWMRLIPLAAGLSLLFPAIIIEMIFGEKFTKKE